MGACWFADSNFYFVMSIPLNATLKSVVFFKKKCFDFCSFFFSQVALWFFFFSAHLSLFLTTLLNKFHSWFILDLHLYTSSYDVLAVDYLIFKNMCSFSFRLRCSLNVRIGILTGLSITPSYTRSAVYFSLLRCWTHRYLFSRMIY